LGLFLKTLEFDIDFDVSTRYRHIIHNKICITVNLANELYSSTNNWTISFYQI